MQKEKRFKSIKDWNASDIEEAAKSMIIFESMTGEKDEDRAINFNPLPRIQEDEFPTSEFIKLDLIGRKYGIQTTEKEIVEINKYKIKDAILEHEDAEVNIHH